MREINDLRDDEQGRLNYVQLNYVQVFWSYCEQSVTIAERLVDLKRLPERPCDIYPGKCGEVLRMWKCLERLRRHGFQPMPGDEIMLRYPGGEPHNGSHRAAALKALRLPVPALLVDNWKQNRIKGKVPWHPKDRRLAKWQLPDN